MRQVPLSSRLHAANSPPPRSAGLGCVTRCQHTSQVTSSTLAATDFLGALRGTPGLRPNVDPGLAGGLRAWLEDGIFELLGNQDAPVVRITPRALSDVHFATSGTALLRGALVVQLLRLQVAGLDVADPFADATEALGASGRDGELADRLADLDDDERSRLAAEVDAHYAILTATLPSLPARWSPRCGVRQAIPLAGGAVVLRGDVDLALGASGGSRACVCLVDVTTARIGPSNEAALSYLALLETLRAGEQPLRVAAISTADGATIVREVTPELLADAVGLVLGAVSRSAT